MTTLNRRQFLRISGMSIMTAGASLAFDIQPVNASVSFSLSRQKAINYALNYANGAGPHYPSMVNEGTDCANFVSQCLHQAGLTMEESWDPRAGWWSGYGLVPFKTRSILNKTYKRSNAWGGAPQLCDYLVNRKIATFVKEFVGTNSSNPAEARSVKAGDIILCDWRKGEGWSHVAIVNSVTTSNSSGDGLMRICQHSPARRDFSFSEWKIAAFTSSGILPRYKIYRVNYTN